MPRRCRQCRSYNIPKDAPKSQFVCGVECSIEYGKAHAKKAQEKAWKQYKKARAAKARNFRLNDRPHQLKLTQQAANKLAALLDKGKPCICCGRPDEGGRKRNASHYKSRGANSGLRFDLRNIHGGCVVCNQHLSGNIAGFTNGLRARYGQSIIDYLDTAPRVMDWDIDLLTKMRCTFLAECRLIESGKPPSRDWRKL